MSEKPTKEDIARMEDEIIRLHREANALRQKKAAAVLAYWGAEVGALIRDQKGRAGEIIGPGGSASTNCKPAVEVRLQKKDGTIGLQTMTFWGDWQVVKPASDQPAS